MNRCEQPSGSSARSRLLPPRGLLLSLLVQGPLILLLWPPHLAGRIVFLGTAMLTGGVVLNFWADRLFKRNGVAVCPFGIVPKLISDGPYRLSRNPMYLGMVLISTAVPLITGVYLNLWAPAALAIWLHIRFVLPEEEFLRKRLGTQYLLYASRNSRWLGLPAPHPAQNSEGATGRA